MHGKGVYAYPNHDKYEGEFADDMKQVRSSVWVVGRWLMWGGIDG